ncbi:NAD-dependent epimerase/dehydratase family protein [Jiella sonneratiae]|uniref:NAD-dependent epimerase/dehydratase family protein n=1 Tax=Jiella sonneratiae TaxID=2816856 RepID=A0ABS3J1H8_9HYPH|nr:NAD(P)-dependent oxidoreductase [Jiella sonneratiae]MBO0902980.1 NAD-dependent epimerase/dehydratase family protein [Jiella sonneratiae]
MPATETSPKRVLLTGATGFVGRQIHRALVAEGHRVRVLVRPASAARLAAPAEIVETTDLFAESLPALRAALADVDTLVHAAWYVEPGRYLEAEENLACLSGSLVLARAAASVGVGHVVGLGTCFEYALPSDRLAVDSPLRPESLYAITKLALFSTLGRFLSGHDVRFSWARLFYLFGEGEHPSRLVPYVRACLAEGRPARLSAGTQLRDFLDVAEAGRMVAGLVSSEQAGAINICSGRPVTLRGFVEAIADENGRRDLLEFGTAALRPGDPAAVVGVPNLAPQASLRAESDESRDQAAHQP